MTPGDVRGERRALAALLAGAVGIAFAPVFVRLSEIGPTSTAFYRLALAVPFMAALARLGPSGAGRRPGGLADRLRLCVPGLCFAADLGVWHWSITFTTVANATLLANFAPVFVTLGGWLLFRRRFRRLFLVGMVLALAGATLLVWTSAAAGGDRRVEGDLLGLLTALFYGAYLLAVGRLREEFSTATIMAWTPAVAALALLPVCALGGESLVPPTARAWAVLLGLTFVSQIAGQGLIAWALAHLPAAFSSVTLLVQPACVALFGWWFFGESFTPLQAVGAVVVVAGIYTARRGSR